MRCSSSYGRGTLLIIIELSSTNHEEFETVGTTVVPTKIFFTERESTAF